MPRFLQPKKSTEHRIAAIALYRALLSGCSSAALPDDDRTLLRNAIQNKFRQNRKIQSPYQLGLSFKLGYETVDKLDASTTNNAAGMSTLSRLIATLPRGLTNAPPTRRPLPSPPTPHPSGKHPLDVLPQERAVLKNRPYTQVTGQRQVPRIASANGIPFLRLSKPQPAALSRVLRQKLDRRIERFHRRVELQNYWLPLAKQEDEWDELVLPQLRRREDEIRWADAMHEAERQNGVIYEAELVKDAALIRKMQSIVDAETEFVLNEGREVIRGRKKAPIRVIKP
ncbi:uncharacterized protein M421DRAFT_57499 [Didymella exigua CBS 183.55]|uniref:Complex 1 LYR protein domain-containing protein n=1 Tax=Didymella exigua CBS 183.55 TaxID=1150837 RepID=A0A6A5RTF3_9PLEO|nr:uncharacterized protein M421DRAFT_57499 [Didymella exigua CBS 183.55]KAF1930819.1 hypothetical protein M421DRAFT_57499 [Didymella exigua CBS 183.55]